MWLNRRSFWKRCWPEVERVAFQSAWAARLPTSPFASNHVGVGKAMCLSISLRPNDRLVGLLAPKKEAEQRSAE